MVFPITISVICYEETDDFFNVIVGSDAVGNSARGAGAANTIVFS